MSREGHFEGSAHADLPENTELEAIKRGNAIARVTSELEQLGVQAAWERTGANRGRTLELEKGGIAEEVRKLQVGKELSGELENGARWKVVRFGPADYEVTTEGEAEEGDQ